MVGMSSIFKSQFDYNSCIRTWCRFYLAETNARNAKKKKLGKNKENDILSNLIDLLSNIDIGSCKRCLAANNENNNLTKSNHNNKSIQFRFVNSFDWGKIT
jgi:hypothetical protein